jgi:uncharacterized membrane protein YheB (UPF0754 family)
VRQLGFFTEHNIHILILLPAVGALTGWVTNIWAIKLLFNPKEPRRFLFFTIQGLIPKRRYELAAAVGAAVDQEFLSGRDILAVATSPELKAEVAASVAEAAERQLRDRLINFVPGAAVNPICNLVGRVIRQEANQMVGQEIDKLVGKMAGKVEVGRLLESRIAELSLNELERVMRQLGGKELRRIELLGGVLGGLIGLVQAFVLIALEMI